MHTMHDDMSVDVVHLSELHAANFFFLLSGHNLNTDA